ncbi:glycosyltransferase family 4 protein [Fictibacillus sp. BK138]|uniref:glycosyltransferase family 4 protein n=1 Tax=Fictibacillus sp. BK138 TaxID=2512121 RepID=UPI001028A150|nr:glycosyltransferase family 4 protein [Fictibacillus sp. BK138]RZT21374.1 glycosyltransferase involved in cell wall biosynthesis [Fictibacillus sp. BK138]
MKKKILIVNSYYDPTVIGGAEISTQLLAEGLQNNFEVFVLTSTKNKSNDIIIEEINGVKIYRMPIKNIYWPPEKEVKSNYTKLLWHLINTFNPVQYNLLLKTITTIKPDIIHTNNLMCIGTYIWRIGKKLSIPVIHTLRDYALIDPVKNKTLSNIISKINIKRAQNIDFVVGISNFIYKEHTNKGFFKNIPVDRIFNVVHTKKYKKTYLSSNTKGLIIGYYGQLAENKGIQILIDIINNTKENLISKIYICGSGSFESKIKELSNFDKRIIFLGKTTKDEVYKLMAQSDLTIVPSIWNEPFGRVIIESYRQGTPVLGSNVGGIPEILVEKQILLASPTYSDFIKKIIFFSELSTQKRKSIISNCYIESSKYINNIKLYIDVYNKFFNKKNEVTIDGNKHGIS